MSVNMLEAAAQRGDIDGLYREIEKDPHVLEVVYSIPFVKTPLHIAASAGHLQFATEIMTLKPSFALKLNPQGLTPIHLALEQGNNRMVLCLIDINKDLVRAKKRGGLTPLHLACQSEEIDLMREFLKVCPDSIQDITVRRETALHVAVKHQKLEALKFLLGWLKTKTLNLERTILYRKDDHDNTILHIAALNNDTEAIKLLIKVMKDFDETNFEGQTALDLTSSEDIKKKLVQASAKLAKIKKIHSLIQSTKEWLIRNSSFRFRTHMAEDMRNAYLVVSTLVATATYQAALSPPGGIHSIDATTNNTLTHMPSNSSISEGKSIMSNTNFITFSTTNMCAFIASTFTIISLLPRHITFIPVYLAMAFLISSYYFSMATISPNNFTTTFVSVAFYFLAGIFTVMVVATMMLNLA